MSLLITFDSGRQRELWIEDMKKPEVVHAIHGMATGVNNVQADGEELEYITQKFSNIPNFEQRPQLRWYGDYAKFIVGNL